MSITRRIPKTDLPGTIRNLIETHQSIAHLLTLYSREETLTIVNDFQTYRFDLSNTDELTFVHLAAKENNLQVLKELHTFGADFSSGTKEYGYSALHFAVDNESPSDEQFEIINYLLTEVKINPDIKSIGRYSQKRTPLAICALKGLVKPATLLLAQGANPNATSELINGSSENILQTACRDQGWCYYEKKIEIIKLLIENGLTISQPSDDNYSPKLDPLRLVKDEYRVELEKFIQEFKKKKTAKKPSSTSHSTQPSFSPLDLIFQLAKSSPGGGVFSVAGQSIVLGKSSYADTQYGSGIGAIMIGNVNIHGRIFTDDQVKVLGEDLFEVTPANAKRLASVKVDGKKYEGTRLLVDHYQVTGHVAEVPKPSLSQALDRLVDAYSEDNDEDLKLALALSLEESKKEVKQEVKLAPIVQQQGVFAEPPKQPASSAKEIPDEYLCPITQCIMVNPVLCSLDGESYEESAIKEWLNKNKTSPMNRGRMENDQPLTSVLFTNRKLKEAIERFLKENPEFAPQPELKK